MTPGSRESSDVGDTQIVLYLHAVTDAQVAALMDACADAVVAQGLGCDDPDSLVLALVGLRPASFPDLDDDAATKAFLDEHAQFIIPSANAAELAEADNA